MSIQLIRASHCYKNSNNQKFYESQDGDIQSLPCIIIEQDSNDKKIEKLITSTWEVTDTSFVKHKIKECILTDDGYKEIKLTIRSISRFVYIDISTGKNASAEEALNPNTNELNDGFITEYDYFYQTYMINGGVPMYDLFIDMYKRNYNLD